jgi:predicted MPP superfamily phosphohydrolase
MAVFILLSLVVSRIFDTSFFSDIPIWILGFAAFYMPLWILFGSWSLLLKSKKIQKRIYTSIFGVSIFLCVLGVWNFHTDITVNTVEISSDKISQEYRFLHITDTQFGSLSRSDLEKISNVVKHTIDEQDIDAILFTGDLIDTNSYTFEDLKALRFEEVPVYFSYGNHEFYHDPERVGEVLKQLGYESLRSERVLFGKNNEIEILGIDDSREVSQIVSELQTLKPVPEKFSILLYHRPSGVLEAKKEGVNLMPVGHTHGGQIFPYTFLVDWLLYDVPIGLFEDEDFAVYHSSGVGLWGPKMRLGTENEIAVIVVKPEK